MKTTIEKAERKDYFKLTFKLGNIFVQEEVERSEVRRIIGILDNEIF